MNCKIKALLGHTLLALSWASSSYAYETELILDRQGQQAFELRIYGPNDGAYDTSDETNPRVSPRDIDENGRQKIRAALERWAEILSLPSGYTPAVINLGTMNGANANAYGTRLTSSAHPNFMLSALQARLQGVFHGSPNDPDAVIGVGELDLDTAPVNPSQLPLTGKADYNAVIFHELAHALGISNTVTDTLLEGSPDQPAPYFQNELSPWALGLRDDQGRAPSPGQKILCSVCANPYDPAAFDLRQDNGYFTGDHVQEVLNGGMRGIPVSILNFHDDPRYGVDRNYMSHTELRNSLMSHQTYRNYVNLMEAEIAALQDIGLTIDRRNFFGYSVYGDDVTLNSTNGYFARNEDGTAYLPDQYNMATQGLGLHIYGARNTITQSADLLTAGPGGVGVRVDGSENTVLIPETTRIHALGWYGRGLQFSYGRHHTIVQQGEVRADGEEGVAALFDFGQNVMGSDDEYHGSWRVESNGQPRPVPTILQGALVSNYDLSGILSGKKSAIHIADNAWVQSINILQGAQITGDITSDYNRRDSNQELLLTRISFGQKADEQGRSTSTADPDFQMHYDGNIKGQNNLAVVIAGGATSLNGQHELYGLRVDQGATLYGNSQFTINPEYNFTNNGTLSPGNSYGSMTIKGNFVQGTDGRILVEASTTQNDHIDVQGLAQLDGELHVDLQPDWYQNG